MANPRWAEASVPRSLPERVAQLYYSHGLMCATYPLFVIVLVFTFILVCSYPLLGLPLPGNVPQRFTVSAVNSNVVLETPRWLQASPPTCFIQQIIMKTAVFPWIDDLKLSDAFRAPLAEVFPLLEAIQNFQEPNSSTTLGDICLHVETVRSKKLSGVLPQYSCLMLSPANLWQLDVHRYHDDTSLINTIYSHQNLQKGKISVAELLFGLNLKDTGMKRYPLRKRQRIIQFAVTLVYQQYHKLYLDGLRERLTRLYPLHQNINDSSDSDYMHHIYYPGEYDYKEFIPLVVTYLMLFFYIYFSMRKIELVHSKVGIALCAVFTVFTSLMMSAGLCFFFGLDFTVSGRGREVFPYLVLVVGLENMLVLTKSVVSTAPHLDVKIRIAQGLMQEGWSITKNLLTEVTILTMGLLTLVPAIQEFCIFAIVGLLCDFFLQTFFFCTVLGLDIRQKEKIEPSQLVYHHYRYNPMRQQPMTRSHSVPRLSYPTTPPKMPKRLQLVHFWARTRIVQRAFMLGMVVWIGGIVYSADVLQRILPLDSSAYTDKMGDTTSVTSRFASPLAGSGGRKAAIFEMEAKLLAAEAAHKQSLKQDKGSDELSRLKPGDNSALGALSPHHWAALLSLYNTTLLSGGYVTLLPPVQLASTVSPDRAVTQRNPLERQSNFQWHSLAVALDPIDFNDGEYTVALPVATVTLTKSDLPFFPSSPMELFLAGILCIISVLVLTYTFVVLYRCICSRNYAEWRASWTGTNESSDSRTQVVLEAVPLVLSGHCQPVECLCSDGNWLVSCCLVGNIRVWDTATGDLVVTISRTSSLKTPSDPDEDILYKELDNVCSTVCSEFSCKSKPKIKTNFPSPNRGCSCEEVRSGQHSARGVEIEARGGSAVDSVAGGGRQTSVSREGRRIMSVESESVKYPTYAPVWCMDCQNNLIVLGCADGRIEIWEASSGKHKCTMSGSSERAGVSCVRLAGHHIVAARLNGSLDFFVLDWVSYQSTYRKTHNRTCSAGSVPMWSYVDSSSDSSFKCHCMSTVRAHQQSITVLDFDGVRVVTGSQDHKLKVFRIGDQTALFTLHGHFGPITALFIDRVTPSTAGSGSQDGLLCVWDLITGACMYSVQAHDGSITSLTYSASYIISLGSDERLCVWERFQGHLLNTIQVGQTYCSSVVMLTHNLLITPRQGSLVVWDVCSGEPVRIVKLGHSDSWMFVHQIVLVNDSVACDYGRQLRIVRFPMVHDKMD